MPSANACGSHDGGNVSHGPHRPMPNSSLVSLFSSRCQESLRHLSSRRAMIDSCYAGRDRVEILTSASLVTFATPGSIEERQNGRRQSRTAGQIERARR